VVGAFPLQKHSGNGAFQEARDEEGGEGEGDTGDGAREEEGGDLGGADCGGGCHFDATFV